MVPVPAEALEREEAAKAEIQLVPAATAGKLYMTPDEHKIVFADVNPNDVEITPNGTVYLPWVFFADRLNESFGPGQWSLVPWDKPDIKGEIVLWPGELWIRGIFVAATLGQCRTTKAMTYGDSAEGARSDCLRRLCKHLGVARELWHPQWVRQWKQQFAVYDKHAECDGKGCYGCKNSGKAWRRKDNRTAEIEYEAEPSGAEEPAADPAQEPKSWKSTGDPSPEQLRKMNAIATNIGIRSKDQRLQWQGFLAYEFREKQWAGNIPSSKDLNKGEVSKIIDRLQKVEEGEAEIDPTGLWKPIEPPAKAKETPKEKKGDDDGF